MVINHSSSGKLDERREEDTLAYKDKTSQPDKKIETLVNKMATPRDMRMMMVLPRFSSKTKFNDDIMRTRVPLKCILDHERVSSGRMLYS